MNNFAGFPLCNDLSKLDADIAIVGIPYGTPYDIHDPAHSLNAPAAIRQESVRFPEDPIAWDFDLGTSLRDLCKERVVDCGDLPGSQEDPEGNKKESKLTIQKILNAGAVPVVLGGDDSIPIPVLRAYKGQEPFHLLQLDAHIDWRNEVKGITDGYSSTMRRASELSWIKGIVQVGIRAVGSARKEEQQAALEYGARLITARQFQQIGLTAVTECLPASSRCFITIDLDVLDPSVMPATGALTPGGLYYQEIIDLIQVIARRTRVVGVCVIGLVPNDDVNRIGAITAMRIIWNVIGALALNIS